MVLADETVEGIVADDALVQVLPSGHASVSSFWMSPNDLPNVAGNSLLPTSIMQQQKDYFRDK
jgi:hypothetical protein